jgi:trigger factor
MNVFVESQPNCLVTLQVELPADRVSREWQNVAQEFQRQVRIPGYRPGKAPKALVDSRYAKDIKDELTNRLLRESLNEAIREKSLRVLSVSDVQNVEFDADKTMRYKATVITAPEFELPDYSSIPGDVAKEAVTEEAVQRWVDQMREPHATYAPVEDRPVAIGDYAVVTYAGTLEGKPLAEAAPNSPVQLQGRQNAWILMDEKSLVPGFAQAIVGMNVNEERTFTLDLPADFPIVDLAGQKLEYKVTLHGINTKTLPAFDDELAGKIEAGATAEQILVKIREHLANMAVNQFENNKRQAAVKYLLSKVDCELPASVVEREMNGILRDIVRENQGRGISDEEIRKHEDQLIGAAQQSARDRVRTNFLLLRIAEKENIQVAEQDVAQRVIAMASQYEIPVNKLVKDLQRREGFGPLREQILLGKALDLLAANVTVRESTEASPEAPAQA